jgi:AraC-like DNA-binding protein
MEKRNFASYLTWSDEEERRLLVCTDVGAAEIPAGASYPPPSDAHPREYRTVAAGRTINEYQIVYITRGGGWFSTRGTEYAVQSGSVLAVFPGVRHSYRPDPRTGWDEYWVGFRGNAADELRRSQVHAPERPFFYVGTHGAVLALFQDIFAAVEKQEPFYQFRAGALILLLLAEIHGRSRKAEQPTESEALVERAKFLMREHARSALSVEAIVGRLGVGEARFSQIFKEYTGLTPYQYFIQLKINEAKRLLDGDRVAVKEVAFSLGFEDPYYFSRLFKKKTGVAPRDWVRVGTGGS